jgi:hypothetical protein
MQISDTVMTILVFITTMVVSCVTCLVLCIAEFVFHRPIPVRIPSVYGPIARIGFSRNRGLRRTFRLLFCNLYRKRFWNPIMNLNNKGFDRQRHLGASNLHAASSALVLVLIVLLLYSAYEVATSTQFQTSAELQTLRTSCYRWAVALVIFELVVNAAPIVLTRYLYLLTLRRPGLNRLQHTSENSNTQTA